MPYPQDLVGKFITYTINAVNPGRVDAAQRTYGVTRDMAERAMIPVYRAQAGAPAPAVPLGPGAGYVDTHQPWTFRFLWYVPGHVTDCGLTDPVLTGPMTGCYLFRFTQAGQTRVAHVGTNLTPTDAKSLEAKAYWAKFLMGGGASNVVGANPVATITTNDMVQGTLAAVGLGLELSGSASVCGYFAGGSAYAMLFVPIKQPQAGAGGMSRLLYVADCKPMPLRPWSAIQNDPAFR